MLALLGRFFLRRPKPESRKISLKTETERYRKSPRTQLKVEFERFVADKTARCEAPPMEFCFFGHGFTGFSSTSAALWSLLRNPSPRSLSGVTYMCCAWIASCPLAKRNAAKRAEALNRRQSMSLTRPRSSSIDDYGVIQKEVQSQAYYVQPNRRFY